MKKMKKCSDGKDNVEKLIKKVEGEWKVEMKRTKKINDPNEWYGKLK